MNVLVESQVVGNYIYNGYILLRIIKIADEIQSMYVWEKLLHLLLTSPRWPLDYSFVLTSVYTTPILCVVGHSQNHISVQ